MAVSMRFLLKLAMLLLWFRFFGIHVKAYIYVMFSEILNMEVLMLRSLGPLIRSGMILCSDEWSHWSIALSPTNRERINQTFKLEFKLILLVTYEETNKRKCYLVVVTSAKTTTRADCWTLCIPNSHIAMTWPRFYVISRSSHHLWQTFRQKKYFCLFLVSRTIAEV